MIPASPRLPAHAQVGAGAIAALSTGGAVSKFGFPLGEVRQQLVAAFVAHPWLNMLHLHVGSQVRALARMVHYSFLFTLCARIVKASPWLNMLHLNVGSQVGGWGL